MTCWSQKYVGIPYRDLGRDTSGCDCWGLACLVYRNELGITLPEFTGAYISAAEWQETAALISKHRQALWRSVAAPGAFDLLLFRRGTYDSHVGIQISGQHMLHIAGDDQAKVETYRSGRWLPRFQGAFQHLERADGSVAQ